MRTRIATSALVSLCATLTLAACSGSDGGQTITEQGEDLGAAPRTVTLTSVNNSGITGTVTVSEKGDSTTVDVALEGGSANTTYANHIHQRTCDNAGPVVVPLTDVTVGQDGSGSATTRVATQPLDDAEQQAGSILVMAHQPDETPAACAVI